MGICPGNNESAGKRKSGKTRKGNAWVRRLLCEFAQAASRSRCALKDKFAALSIRKGHKKSIVALAHKMLRIVFAVLKNKTPYLDKAVDYEALSVQRNAPRWMKCVFRSIVTDRFGIVTAEFGNVTDRFGDVTDGVLKAA